MMKIFPVPALFLFGMMFVMPVVARDEPLSEPQRPAANQQPQVNMFRQLGLNREQIQKLQQINRTRKPLMDAAQEKLRNANRLLDEAIYADEVSDVDIQAKLKDMQLAQAEVLKVRFTSELAIRRMLTPEQLVRFRNMRQRFERARAEAENRRANIRESNTRYVNPNKEVKAPLKANIKPDDM